jgi:DNA ligase (NAD+)
MLRNIADIYSLRKLDLEGSSDVQSNNTERMSLRELKGWGDRSVNNLLAAIDDRQSLAFDRFLFGLGIRHIGLGSARDIAKEFGDFDVFWEYIKKIADMESAATEEMETGEGKAQEREKKKESDERCSRLYGIPGIGPKIIISLIDYASTSTTRALVDSLLLDVKVLPSSTAAAPRSILEGSLANETFLFTGKLERLTRGEASDLCTSLGAQVSSSFTSDVTVLVNAGGGSRESTKLKKAKANEKVRVIDEGDFLKMVNTA